MRSGGQGILGNYFDIANGNEYWISGAKKNEANRLFGGAKIMIDKNVIAEYLLWINKEKLDPSHYAETELDHWTGHHAFIDLSFIFWFLFHFRAKALLRT